VPLEQEHVERFERAYGFPIPRGPGLRAAHLLERTLERPLDVLYLVGGNHLETMPDRRHARCALARVKCRVHQDIVINTSTLIEPEGEVIVLPAETRYEQKGGGTSTSTERRIRFTPEIPGPRIAEARAEWEIPALIGRKLHPSRSDLFDYETSADVRKEMGRLMPLYAGIERLEREGDALQWGGPQLGAERFDTPDGRARFSSVALPRVEVPEGRMLLALRRGRQFNSMIYGKHDPIARNAERDAILLDQRDLEQLRLSEGQRVLVSSDTGQLLARVRVGPCRAGHVQGYWPECNVLIPRKYDPDSGEPDYTTSVRIEPLSASGASLELAARSA
jgi:predicted molibdopterin-dependent oxidoreductase YjgC